MDKPILFEFLGSFAISFFGSFLWINNVDDFVTIGLGFFLIYTGILYSSKIYSGSLMNPILTLSLLLTDTFSHAKVVGYVVV